MDIIETVKKDKAYIKYKSIVKNWEKDFKCKYSRTPSKFDIKEAPSNIKYAYKKYFQLKSAALENSLSICEAEEELFLSPESSQPLETLNIGSIDSQSAASPDPIIPALPSDRELAQLLSNGNGKEDKQNDKKLISLFSGNLSKKLFESRRFSLRNPRKVSQTKSQSVLETSNLDINSRILSSQSEEDINDENTLHTLFSSYNYEIVSTNNVSPKKSCRASIIDKIDSKTPTCMRQLNEAWLSRATGLSNADLHIIPQIPESKSIKHSTEKYGLNNISITNAVDKLNDYVENSESETEDVIKLKPALKKRKLNDHNDDDMIIINEDIDSKKPKGKMILKKLNQKGSIKNGLVTNTEIDDNIKDDRPPDIAEFLPFGPEENITPRHPKADDVLKVVSIPGKSSVTNNLNTKSSEKIQNKIKNGTLNDNFIRINIEKKVFVRGKKNINYSKYKKQLWKEKKTLHASMEFPESGKISCFKCGANGHMARYCAAHKGDILLPLENYNDDDIPTLDDMQTIQSKATNCLSLTDQLNITAYEPSTVPESFMQLLRNTSNIDSEVQPIYNNYKESAPIELHEALKMFGHESFRPGQEEAIMRILCGMSTLLILSTGGGKSLCYQLPAYIYSQHYQCITLVISPLVSLMEDQVLNMPEFLKAGCLHTNQSPTLRRKIVQCIKDGEINILLISPEALISDGSQGFTGLFKCLPQIAFACIDEAHCVSQWSHNFRPSYLMICKILREKLKVKCILGLTATASQTTIKSIIGHINIPDGMKGVLTNPTLPDNLCLSVSKERDKDRALISLLTSERFDSFHSIIVYCVRRDECQRVAAVLRSCLQQAGKINMEVKNNKRKRMSYIAEPYHAGMSAAQRKKIQKNFMEGTLRIIVATVAFGMGINKSNINCIIHYNVPSNFESYVQEVGRAGRDGKSAFCHVFLSENNNDKSELLKHIHANSIDRPTIRKLLQKVFIPCECTTAKDSSLSRCKGHEVAIPIDTTVEELDLPSENIATLLCYIELHPKQYIKVLNNAYTMCKISSYGGPQIITQAAKNCPPLAMAYLMEGKKDPQVITKSIIEFQVVEVAAAIGWESGMTKYHLKNLEWITEGGTSKRSQLKVEFNTLGFRIKAPGDLLPAELDSILDDLQEIVNTQEKVMLYQLEESHRAFHKFGNYSLENIDFSRSIIEQKSNELKHIIRNYFQREDNLPSADVVLEERPLDKERVISDVCALISSYKDCSFTGRSIARIFQGISSPNYPAIVWGRCKFWRSHIHEDFYGIIRVATRQIIRMKV